MNCNTAITPSSVGRLPLALRRAPLSAVSAAALCLSLTGCTLGNVALSGGSAEPAQVSGLSGMIHGGDQPVVGATITIYQVGTTGYGTGASAIAGATTTTKAGGFFQVPAYTCPSASTLVYLVATGGNPGLSATDSVSSETVTATATAGTNTVTFTGANSYRVGQSVTLAGFTTFSYLNGTQTVTAVTPGAGGGANTAFSVTDTSASDPGPGNYTDNGTVSGTAATNPNLKLVAPIGACSGAATTNVLLNEVVDAAAAFSLAQYISPTTGQIGAPNTTQAQIGIANAFNTFNNLVTLSTGAANASSTKTANGFTITLTPENTKLNTVADILAACVNSPGGTEGDGSNCGTLFANVGTTTYPTDTFAAAVDMALNPTSTTGQITNLYGLIAPQPPFPGVSAQPTDWTVGILFTDTTTNTPVLPKPQNLAIDASGNVWVASYSTGALGEISPTGSPLVGTSTLNSLSITSLSPRNMAIDPSGNVWLATTSSSGTVFEYNPGTSTATSLTLGTSPYGLAIDGSGNVFFGHESGSDTTTVGSITEFPGGTLSATNEVTYPLNSSTSNTLRPEYLAFDPSGNLWATDGSDQASTIIEITNITPCSPAPCTVTQSSSANVYNNITVGGPSGPYGVAGGLGGIWWANRTAGSMTYLTVSGSTAPTTAPTGSPFGSSAVFSKPEFVVVDGAGNVWTANNGSSSNAGVQELSSTGASISPTNARGYLHANLASPLGIGVDPSGNVWIANNVASGSTGGASIFEIVGAAAPTITPLANALGSKIGTKP
jgi:hypothetical protein